MSMALITYKPEQGRLARLFALGILGGLAYYATASLYHFLSWDWAIRELGFTIPVLEVPVTPGFLIVTALFIGSLLALRAGANNPKIAELLIDTEGEVRRVTWPSWQDTLNGSFVVIVTVVAMLLVLSAADFVLSHIFENIIFRQ